jgi:hypothetical protein
VPWNQRLLWYVWANKCSGSDYSGMEFSSMHLLQFFHCLYLTMSKTDSLNARAWSFSGLSRLNAFVCTLLFWTQRGLGIVCCFTAKLVKQGRVGMHNHYCLLTILSHREANEITFTWKREQKNLGVRMQDLRLSQRWLWRVLSSGIWSRVVCWKST